MTACHHPFMEIIFPPFLISLIAPFAPLIALLNSPLIAHLFFLHLQTDTAFYFVWYPTLPFMSLLYHLSHH
jgi:hypothetical protein